MTDPAGDDPRIRSFVHTMRAAKMPEEAVATFVHHLRYYLEGDQGTLGHDRIEPAPDLPDAGDLGDFAERGAAALERTVVVKLNGGLGTSMGLERAKSLLEVRDGLSFLDLIARQVRAMRKATGSEVPLLMMNSFRTADDTERALASQAGLSVRGLPLGFRQHRVPKVLVDGDAPAQYPADRELEWCPPGHGDVYTALRTSGTLGELLAAGIELAFLSNADNLGAVIDTSLLGYMVSEGLEFMMEVADRTHADRKGGHLCRLRGDGLALRESAQCPPDEQDEFQDIDRYRYFNTNNLWVHLPTLARLLDDHGGVLPLATIVNHKTLDPRDPSSPPVVQLETAMGSAISIFDRAAAVRVPRRRFSPVKNTDDLLAVRSDAYRLTDDFRVVLAPGRTTPPTIQLDASYYKLIDDFESRFPYGAPSLIDCASLTVEGNVRFGADVVVRGEVHVRAGREPAPIEDGTVLTGALDLG
jgi:UTP--glucose-1-phosphate uridylyltransferase